MMIDKICEVLGDVLDAFGGGGPLLPEDRPRWAAAKTLPDLCDLTAQWLAGDIQSQPSYYGPVDVDEDDAPGLTATLIALNRAGFLTHNSQCGFDGTGYDGAHWTQIASVVGFCDDVFLKRLRHEPKLRGHRISIRASRPDRPYKRNPGDDVIVTRRDGHPYTGFGGQLRARQVADLYDGCSDEAIEAVRSANHVVIYTYGGHGNGMWPVLLDAFGR